MRNYLKEINFLKIMYSYELLFRTDECTGDMAYEWYFLYYCIIFKSFFLSFFPSKFLYTRKQNFIMVMMYL